MTKSDSLDNITLDSDELRTIERFENNYHDYNKNKLQNGGNEISKRVKNINRLYNCYVLSYNQNGGDDKLTNIIKSRFDKKILELNN
jgi:hypothetical protein